MQLTTTEFKKKLKNQSLGLGLIGMSNIGKSFRAKQLADEKKFNRLSVDEAIEKKLGLKGIEAVARWMGPPYDPHYFKTEEKYLATESAVMEAIQIPDKENFVLDMTGSVIYLNEKILEWLKNHFLIVHLDISAGMLDKMTDLFFSHPKPVIWKGMFQIKPKESPEVAFRRCYPEWLKFRLKKYRELADVSISGEYSRNENFTCEQFLEAIESAL